MPKNHKNLKVYAYHKKNNHKTAANINNNNKICPKSQMYPKTQQVFVPQNIYYLQKNSEGNKKIPQITEKKQAIIIKKIYAKDNSCCNIF